MTLEELKKGLEKVDFSIESSSFPGSYLGVCKEGGSRAARKRESAKEFIRENGNSCRIISTGSGGSCNCICFSVGEWLYFVEETDRVCLRRTSWNQVVFLDTDLIEIKEDGDPE